MIVSFTRTAAKEIATKESVLTGEVIDIPEKNVGTLHSICFNALKSPKIIETEKDLIWEWNRQHSSLAINHSSVNSFDHSAGEEPHQTTKGDLFLKSLNIKRNKMIDPIMWSLQLREFSNLWEKFKKEHMVYDFTDLIQTCLETMPYAPGHPKVLFVDEAQDFTKLQLALCRSWGEQMEWIVLAGDDDQTIFGFAGASPDAFLDPPVPDNQKTVLNQSYRLPEDILNRATKLIERVGKREPKVFSPRKEIIEKDVFGITWGDTATGKLRQNFIYKWNDEVKLAKMAIEIQNYIDANKTIMVLASCSFMLKPIEKVLREKGIPFSNKYRRTRLDWNPLYGGHRGTSAVDLLKSFFGSGIDENYWNIPQLVTWAKFLKVKKNGLKRIVGNKAIKALDQAIKDASPGLHTSRHVLDQILEPKGVKAALARDIDWLKSNLKKARKTDQMDYIIKVYKNHELSALEHEPLCTIGTIHSVKGGEAQIVFLFPDISMQANYEFQHSELGKQAAFRIFYVGMTRASEELILCPKATSFKSDEEKMFVKL